MSEMLTRVVQCHQKHYRDFKLHLVVNDGGNTLSYCVTVDNFDNRQACSQAGAPVMEQIDAIDLNRSPINSWETTLVTFRNQISC